MALLSELVYVAAAPPKGDTAGTATMLVAANAMFSYDLIAARAAWHPPKPTLMEGICLASP